MNQDKPTVLYVDDQSINLKLFEATFRNDYDLILTQFPEEVLHILEKKEVEVLVSDQRMPGMMGTELLEIVAEKYPDTRRYLLTAFTDAETVIEAVNVGHIHGYIKKPMQADEVRASISNSLEVYHLRRKNRQIMEELEKANVELLNLDGLKTEIINSISNEISAPLNQIMGTLHLLKSKIEGDELSEVVNILDNSVFKLEQFSLLARQISLLKSPGFSLNREQVSLSQIIQYGAIETSEELKDPEVNLNNVSGGEDYPVNGDSDLLVSCLVNLIRFAKGHAENPGEIKISVYRNDKEAVCQIEDQGNNYTPTLFDLLGNHFSKNDSPLNLTMGIGLAVSRMIMEAHGGQLVFEKSKDETGQIKMVFPHE